MGWDGMGGRKQNGCDGDCDCVEWRIFVLIADLGNWEKGWERGWEVRMMKEK